MEKYVIVIEENVDPQSWVDGDSIPRSNFYFVSNTKNNSAKFGWDESKVLAKAVSFNSKGNAKCFMSNTKMNFEENEIFMIEKNNEFIFIMKESEAVTVVITLGELRGLDF